MRFRNLKRLAALTVMFALASSCMVFAEATYRESVEKWRQAYQASLTSDTGWLTVSGLFWLKEGENRIGSAPGNDVLLPATALASVGVLTLHAGKATVQVNPGVAVTLDGKPVETAELKPDSTEDRLVLGDLTLYVH